MHASQGKRGSFSLKNIWKHYFNVIYSLKQSIKKFHIFGQHYGLTPLENLQFNDYIPCTLFESRKDRFLSRTSRNIISMCFRV